MSPMDGSPRTRCELLRPRRSGDLGRLKFRRTEEPAAEGTRWIAVSLCEGERTVTRIFLAVAEMALGLALGFGLAASVHAVATVPFASVVSG